MTSVIAVVLVLGGLIFFHELGHFLVARALGMGVKAFSLGFGPRIWGFTRGKTEYKLSLIPLGGYVNLAGESPDATEEENDGFSKDELFMARPPSQRLLVVLAGPVFNFILGWLIYWGMFVSMGQVMLYEHPVVGLLENSPAVEAGILEGDVITGVDGSSFYDPMDLLQAIMLSGGDPLVLQIEREGAPLDVTVNPAFMKADPDSQIDKLIKRPKIGVEFSTRPAERPLGPTLGVVDASKRCWATIVSTARGFVMLFNGQASLKAVGGPIMIVEAVGKEARAGILGVLFLAAFISINLGMINLLPIPVLDGGHIMFFTYEMIFRKPVSDGVRRFSMAMGLTLLLALMGLAFYNDLYRIFLS